MHRLLTGLVIVLGLAALLMANSLFVVHQNRQALVTEFGKPKRVINASEAQDRTPGLKWKIPFIESVDLFDKRILDFDTSPLEVIASDQKRLVVDAFARYRIVDPLRFYQTVRDERFIRTRLGPIIEASLRRVLGGATFQEVVRTKREDLMARIAQQVNVEGKALGLEIVDVRIKRADLPEANSEAVFKRMQTERQREAAEFRAEGGALNNQIRAEADRKATVIKAEATRDGEIIRGEGDGERNRIFNDAFSRDPDFFSFYRAMQAYEASLKSGDTRMLLSPNSEFFKYFSDPMGGAAPAAPAPSGRAEATRPR